MISPKLSLRPDYTEKRKQMDLILQNSLLQNAQLLKIYIIIIIFWSITFVFIIELNSGKKKKKGNTKNPIPTQYVNTSISVHLQILHYPNSLLSS